VVVGATVGAVFEDEGELVGDAETPVCFGVEVGGALSPQEANDGMITADAVNKMRSRSILGNLFLLSQDAPACGMA
jgi:hypothetical protein